MFARLLRTARILAGPAEEADAEAGRGPSATDSSRGPEKPAPAPAANFPSQHGANLNTKAVGDGWPRVADAPAPIRTVRLPLLQAPPDSEGAACPRRSAGSSDAGSAGLESPPAAPLPFSFPLGRDGPATTGGGMLSRIPRGGKEQDIDGDRAAAGPPPTAPGERAEGGGDEVSELRRQLAAALEQARVAERRADRLQRCLLAAVGADDPAAAAGAAAEDEG